MTFGTTEGQTFYVQILTETTNDIVLTSTYLHSV